MRTLSEEVAAEFGVAAEEPVAVVESVVKVAVADAWVVVVVVVVAVSEAFALVAGSVVGVAAALVGGKEVGSVVDGVAGTCLGMGVEVGAGAACLAQGSGYWPYPPGMICSWHQEKPRGRVWNGLKGVLMIHSPPGS